MAEQHHNEFAEIERQLTAMLPMESRVNRAELLFRAGQASVDPSDGARTRLNWLWPITTALLAVVTVGLSWQLYNTDEPQVVQRIKYVQVPTVVVVDGDASGDESEQIVLTSHNRGSYLDGSRDSSLGRNHYVRQRSLALRMGLDALGEPQADGDLGLGGLPSYRELKTAYWTHNPSRSVDEATRLLNETL